MMENASDKIVRLYSRLNSLKQNLPSGVSVNQKYIKEYHCIIDDLQNITQLDLSEFKVPEEEVKHTLTSYNYRTGEKHYSKEKYCEKNFLLTKLDALLGYFQIKYFSEEKRTIGSKKE